MRSPKKRGPLVSEVSRGKTRIERGESAGVTARRGVTFVTQFSMGPDQPVSLSKYLEVLEGNGYVIVVISTCNLAEPLRFLHEIPEVTVVIRRPNLGYNFGSWVTALDCIPSVRGAPVVLLTNDPLLGLFVPIDRLSEQATKLGLDIRGLTASYQFARHTQSFFLAFRGGVLADRLWVNFFNDVRIEPDRDGVMLFHELDAPEVCFSGAYFPGERVTGPDLGVPYGDPTVDGWRKLMEYDVPFPKRTTMTHPSTLSEGAKAAAYVVRRYNTGIAQW